MRIRNQLQEFLCLSTSTADTAKFSDLEMLQKTLNICVLLSAFFDSENEEEIWNCLTILVQRIFRKAQVSLAIFDMGNYDECKLVNPFSYVISKNVKKICGFLKIF